MQTLACLHILVNIKNIITKIHLFKKEAENSIKVTPSSNNNDAFLYGVMQI